MDEGRDPSQPLPDDYDGFVEKLNDLGAVPVEPLRFFEDGLLVDFREEDEILLPALETVIGRFGAPLNVAAYEHEALWVQLAQH
jgi:hypothetical protein